jgi:LPXTG-motif cell wall-anchored protein
LCVTGDNYGSLKDNFHYPNYVWLGPNNISFFNEKAGTNYESITQEQANKLAQSLFGANVVIHLAHKTQETTEQKTRTATVKYVNAKTGESMGNAQVNVFYKRTTTTDLATNKTTSTGWQLDTSQGTNGYTVTSGNWTLANGNISVDVPTIANYKAFTSGDWSNNVPANVFSISGLINNTNDNVEQTVYYAPETEARTITAYFKIFDGNKNDQDFDPKGPKAQVQVFYKGNPTKFATNNSTNSADWTITYDPSSWQWDKTAGDAANPGFHIISGTWTLSQTGIAVVPPAAGSNYTIANMRFDGNFSTFTFASPNSYPSTVFTNNTDPTWFKRNELTTYYVPTSELNKNITRTINITDPTGKQTSDPQTVAFSRKPFVNSDDTGATYSNWKLNSATANWAAYIVPTYQGYKPVITQTNADGTTTTLTSIPQQNVTADTAPVTINVAYTANEQTATVEFVDDDENGKVVNVTSAPMIKGKTGETVKIDDLTNLTLPTNYSLVSGQTYTFTAAAGQTVTIHLKHQTVPITDPTQAEIQQTRTLTLHYVNAETGQAMSLPDAVLDVYYKRSAAKDLVTTKIVYGDWQLDTDQGDQNHPGYHVAAGTWMIANGKISAAVPTITGYTTFTSGDWSKNTPANEFVANTNADVEQTVYYAQDDAISRTITEHFVAIDGNKKTQIFPDAVLRIFFIRSANGFKTNGSTDHTKWTISYGDWQWNTNAEGQDTNHPGFKVINGNWDLTPVSQNDKSIHLNLPDAPEGYTRVSYDGHTYSTEYFSTPIAISRNPNLFTSKNDPIWYNRNELTTYYVSNSSIQRQVKRIINVTEPGATTPQVLATQLAEISRQVNLNDDDSGVAYSNWNSDATNWAAYTVPTYTGYTPVITQTVTNPDGTTNTTTVNSIPAQTVDGNTLPTTINISYTATAMATLSGNNQKTYNGKPITGTDLNGGSIKVVVKGPKSGNYALKAGDVEFLSDNDNTWKTTMPTNAGHYQIRLTDQGKQNIEQQFGNSSIKWVDANGNSTITGTAEFDIDQAVAQNLQLTGKLHSTYNGQTVNFDPSDPETLKNIVFNNASGLTIPTFSTSDFAWYSDSEGKHAIPAPKDKGTYYLRLNDKGQQKFATNNLNYSFVDANGQSTITGYLTYTIDPADLEVTVSGKASKVYDGEQAKITQEQLNNGDIKLIWNVWNNNSTQSSDTQPSDLEKLSLTPDDFEVVNAQGQPVHDANASGNVQTGNPKYSVRLSTAGQNKLKKLAGMSNYNLSFKSDASYLIYQRKAQLTLTGTQTTPYGDQLPLDASKYHAELSNWPTDSTTPKPTIGSLQKGDVYIDGYENGSLPTNVGTYQVKISQQLLTKLQHDYPNYDWTVVGGTNNDVKAASNTVDAEHDPAAYIITPAVTTVTINGAQHIKYGQDHTIKYGDGGYTISIVRNATNMTPTPKIITDQIKLPANYLEFGTTPSSVGNYPVKLTAAAIDYLNQNYHNYNWDQAKDAYAEFYVDQMPVTISINNTKTVTYGSQDWQQAIKAAPNGFDLQIKDADGKLIDYTLKAGDLAYQGTPGNAGSYQVVLTDQGLQNIKKQLGTNYSYPQTAADVTSKALLVINKADITVTLNGNWTKQFGQDITPAASQLTYDGVIYTADGTTQTITAQPSDIDYTGDQVPHNVGQYQTVISPLARERIMQLDGNNGQNYNWTWASNASLTIAPATGAAVLKGKNSKVYNGQPTTIDEVNNNGKIIVNLTYTVDGQVKQLGSYTLQKGDYTWLDAKGNTIAAPTKVGQYTIQLNPNSILTHLQARFDNLAGTGKNSQGKTQSNVVIAPADLSGSAEFDITQAQATVTISGTQTSTDPNAQLDPKNFKLTSDQQIVIPAGLTYELANKAGVPTKAGKYPVQLTADGLKKLQDANPDYKLDVNSQVVFNLQATLNIIFQDSQNNNAQVGKTIVKNGDANTWIGLNDVKLPDNYVLAPGQASLPAGYTFTDALTTNMIIKLVHAKQELAPETKTITRTINISEPGKKKQTIVQKATVTRSMIKDLVTGQISYGSWSTASWPGYTLAKLPHYQVKIEQTVNGQTTKLEAIDPVTVTVDTPSAVVNVTYVKQSKPKPDKPHKPHKPAKPNKPNRPSKPTVPNIPGSQRLPDGTIVGPHGEVYYKNGRWTRVGLYDLPQTSSKDQSLAAVTGGLLSSLGLLSLLWTRKRKRKDQ